MSKTKVYIYTRVSTSMQIDGYSLDAQKARMKAFCEYNDYEIAGEYEDAGKSGKSIEGRAAFNRMFIIGHVFARCEKGAGQQKSNRPPCTYSYC